MESFRTKRSKISGIPDFNSAHRFFSKDPPFSLQPQRQGNRHVHSSRNFPKLASDSSSCSSGTADDDSFTFELGLRSSKQALGTPMKKLLAKEMSEEMESKRRSPSVIAKLMGLDGLPMQQSAHREVKGMSESYLQATRSAEKGQQNCHRYDNRSSRKSSKDEKEFKDVFEVLEPSKVARCSYPPSQGTANSNLTDAEIAFIRQKFMDAKRLSTDEKLHHSKEFNEALEVLDSNKDLLLKFLQQPDSLFTKHLHDLQGATPQPLCDRIAAMKSSEPHMYRNARLISKSGREPLHRNRTSSSQKHRDRRPCQSDYFAAQNSLKLSKSESGRKGESTTQPTRIVVLKPNLGKVLNGTNAVSSPCSSHNSLSESRKDRDIPLSKNREVEVLGRRKFQRDGEISGHKSRESRELAKEITRQMRNSLSSSSPKFSSTAFMGYAGDESSCSLSGNESANELEVRSTSSKYSFDLNNHSRPLSSRSTESSVSREAKKRLSERWKLTHKSQEMGAVSRGSTLADMLAIDKERRTVHLDGITDAEGFRNKSSRESRPAGWVEPLGISSRDGWKDGCIAGLSRSRSLPSSSTVFGSPKVFMRREPIREDKYVIPKETFKRERIKAQKSNLENIIVERNSRSNSKKSNNLNYIIRESDGNLSESRTIHNQMDIELEFGSPVEKKVEEVESSAGNMTDRSPVPKTPTNVEHEEIISTKTPDKLLPKLSSGTLVTDASNADGGGDLNLLEEPSAELHEDSSLPLSHTAHGLESPASSKEAEQPSPVSVLEVPFADDLSSCSECFGSLSADLQGLRMQLQLLKLESESYEEGPMVISSDEDVGEGSTGFSYASGLYRSQQSWEYCYVVDVLLHSGLEDADPDVFLAAWHSAVSPISPLVFEELEKKNFDHQNAQPKSERRLLFDRINSGILEMYRQFTDPHPWVRSTTALFGPRWSKNQLQDDLIRLLASQVKKLKKEASEKVLASEEQWLDIRYNIDVIGGEFGKLLLDELLEELLVAI